jgi:hypothetical protein
MAKSDQMAMVCGRLLWSVGGWWVTQHLQARELARVDIRNRVRVAGVPVRDSCMLDQNLKNPNGTTKKDTPLCVSGAFRVGRWHRHLYILPKLSAYAILYTKNLPSPVLFRMLSK